MTEKASFFEELKRRNGKRPDATTRWRLPQPVR